MTDAYYKISQTRQIRKKLFFLCITVNQWWAVRASRPSTSIRSTDLHVQLQFYYLFHGTVLIYVLFTVCSLRVILCLLAALLPVCVFWWVDWIRSNQILNSPHRARELAHSKVSIFHPLCDATPCYIVFLHIDDGLYNFDVTVMVLVTEFSSFLSFTAVHYGNMLPFTKMGDTVRRPCSSLEQKTWINKAGS